MTKSEKFFAMVFEKDGNPSVQDLIATGMSEEMAVHTVVRMASSGQPSKVFKVASARKLYQSGILTYKGEDLSVYCEYGGGGKLR